MTTSDKPKLKPIKKEFSQTWRLFAAGWWKFLILLGPPMYAMSVSSAFMRPDARSTSVTLALLAVLIASVVVSLISLSGMIYSLDKQESISVKEMYRRGRHYAASLFWVMLLTGLIVGLGLLLVVPGLIFVVRYGFAPYSLVCKGLRGMKALQHSRELVRGYWWPVFGRLIIFYIIQVTAMLQATIMLREVHPNAVLIIVQPIVTIFSAIYYFVIFKELEEIKHPETSSPSGTPYMSSPSPLADF